MPTSRPILILGANGQVGFELVRAALPDGDVVAWGREDANIADPQAVADRVRELRPRWILNAAAYTAVDRAESEPDAATMANHLAVAAIAEAASEISARVLHYSTDYVFDGSGTRPYREDDPVAPLGVYGLTKLGGEQAVLRYPEHVVLRVSWVYARRGRNFVATMRRLAAEGKPIRVVDDQIGAPTWARAIAEASLAVVRQLERQPEATGGLFHVPSGSSVSWCGFAREILRLTLGSAAPEVQAIPTSAFPTPARRPQYSVLDGSRISERFGIELPHWARQLELALADSA